MTDQTRRAWRLKAGDLGRMHIVRETLPPPAAGEVTVDVKAIGLNFADIYVIWGLYSATPEGEFTPGLEYSGLIKAVGEGVTGFSVGDRVMGVTRFGAYADGLNIDHRYVTPLPADWSFDEGAAYLVQVLTAYYALRNLGDLQGGQTVLIHSAAGGVGTWANRIAKQYDAYTIGTVGRESKLEQLKEEGYDRGIVRGRNFAQDLAAALDGRPLHIVLECIGGRIWRESYEAMAPQGRCIVYGSARYTSVGRRPNYLRLLWYYLTRPKLDPQSMTNANKGVLGFNLIWLYHQVDLMRQLLDELGELDLGHPLVGETFPFEDLPQAILRFQTGETVGKVVVSVEDL